MGFMELNGPNVFALPAIAFMVGTGAVRLVLVRPHRVPRGGLCRGGDEQHTALFDKASGRGDLLSQRSSGPSQTVRVSRRSPVEAAETPAFSGVHGADSEPETAPAALFRH